MSHITWKAGGRRAHRSRAGRSGSCPLPGPAPWCRPRECARQRRRGSGRVKERHQGCRGRAHPVRERRYIEVDAFALVDIALTIERQVQAVLGEQDMGEQLRPCTSTRNREGAGGWVIRRRAPRPWSGSPAWPSGGSTRQIALGDVVRKPWTRWSGGSRAADELRSMVSS
jgi:hypothetical protein